MASTAVTVFLVDDHDSFRESTKWLLEDHGFTVHDFASAPAFLEAMANDGPPDGHACLLTDLRMPEMNGLELIAAMSQRGLKLPVVFISGHGDVPLAVEAMRKGAANFLEKPVDDAMLAQALRLAAHQPGARPRDPERAEALLERLTPREYQVMELVCSGKLNKTIADVLDISIKTVELHRANLMQKMEARNVSELIHRSLGY